MSETMHRGLRLALASLLLVALLAQLVIGMSRSSLTVANFLSFFTVLSTGAAVVMLTLLAAEPDRGSSPTFAVYRGAVTLYITVTGLIYVALTAPVASEVGISEPWIDWSIHVVGPIAIFVDWILHPPPTRMSRHAILIWLVFPAAYLGYTLIRGAVLGWYPYPILDPSEAGYVLVAVWSVVGLLTTVVLGFAYHWWSNRRLRVASAT